MQTRDIVSSHPDLQGRNADLMILCIDACLACAQTCTTCADACLSEPTAERLKQCIRLCLDCADLCATTGIIASRPTGTNRPLLRELLATCATACRLCGDECQSHASHHDHCRICAEACLACAEACQRAMGEVM